jgi:putative acetyltransferase
MTDPYATSDVLVIRQEDPGQPDGVEPLRHGEAFSAQSNHHLPLDGLRKRRVHFFARGDNGIALATGAVVIQDGWAEIRRMWWKVRGAGALPAASWKP